MNFKKEMSQILQERFHPQSMEIMDHSAQHAGHAQAIKSGGGHYVLTIVSSAFENKSKIERHRMVYEALKHLFKSQIHALSIRAWTPEENDQFAQERTEKTRRFK